MVEAYGDGFPAIKSYYHWIYHLPNKKFRLRLRFLLYKTLGLINLAGWRHAMKRDLTKLC